MEKGTLLIVTSPYFVGGLFYKERASPIIQYMVNWDFNKIKSYCDKKKWSVKTPEEVKKVEEEYEVRAVDRDVQWKKV